MHCRIRYFYNQTRKTLPVQSHALADQRGGAYASHNKKDTKPENQQKAAQLQHTCGGLERSLDARGDAMNCGANAAILMSLLVFQNVYCHKQAEKHGDEIAQKKQGCCASRNAMYVQW